MRRSSRNKRCFPAIIICFAVLIICMTCISAETILVFFAAVLIVIGIWLIVCS